MSPIHIPLCRPIGRLISSNHCPETSILVPTLPHTTQNIFLTQREMCIESQTQNKIKILCWFLFFWEASSLDIDFTSQRISLIFFSTVDSIDPPLQIQNFTRPFLLRTASLRWVPLHPPRLSKGLERHSPQQQRSLQPCHLIGCRARGWAIKETPTGLRGRGSEDSDSFFAEQKQLRSK